MVQTLVFGSSGADNIQPGADFDGVDDLIFAGAGNDFINLSTTDANVIANAGSGDDIILVGSQNSIVGGAGNDQMFVVNGDSNVLVGGTGTDQFWVVSGEIPTSTNLNVVADYSIAEGDVIGIGLDGITTADVLVTQSVDIPTDAIVSVSGVDVARVAGIDAASLNVIDGATIGFNNSILIIPAAPTVA